MIYAPVCACNGMVYSNDCLAQCDGNTLWGPVDPTLVPGMPCSLSACNVSIVGDSIPCNYPSVIEAISAGTAPITSIVWTDAQGNMLSNGNLLTVGGPGMYYVSVADSSGCTDSAVINMQYMSMTIYSIPNPPNICLGDSVYLVHDTSYVNTIWTNAPQLSNPATFFPTTDITYFAQANDQNGCVRMGEIFVDVDSCASNIRDLDQVFLIYPNPSNRYLYIENNFNFKYDISLIDITGKSVYDKTNNIGSIELNIPKIKTGIYILKIESYSKSLFKKIIIE
tara:strand:- start:174 stop:1016 length:843 start_codon:yes stop_codon:yes gene_type:complete